jgi:hypothetical protein
MKITGKASKILLCSILSVGMASSALAATDQVELVRHIRASLSSVVLPEMAAQAAQLVKDANKSEKLATAIAVTQQAIQINPALSITVVSEISKAEPKVAAEVALAAARIQPNYITSIAKAAVEAAPSQTSQIVFELCREYPNKFNLVMASAANAAADSQRQVWEGVTQALPGVKSIFEQRGFGLSAQEIININVNVVNSTLAQVNAIAKSISNSLGQINGVNIVSFRTIATAILNGTLNITDSTSISTSVLSLYTSAMVSAGLDPLEAGQRGSASGPNAAADPAVIAANLKASQTSLLVTGAQTFKVTGERVYANP